MKSFVEEYDVFLDQVRNGEYYGYNLDDVAEMVWDMWDGSQEQADSRAAEEKRAAPEPRARPAFRFGP